MTGEVIKFNPVRGFGRIRAISGRIYRFHAKDLRRHFPVLVRQTVRFDIDQGIDGWRAVNVEAM